MQQAMSGAQLCGAARDGDTAQVGMLLSTQGAQFFINYQNARGTTLLFFGAKNGYPAVTTQLIAARCNVDLPMKNGTTAALRGLCRGFGRFLGNTKSTV
jgi:hypothetical protein